MFTKSLTISILLASISIGIIMPFEALTADQPNDISKIHFAEAPIVIDGKNLESDWQKAKWLPLTHHILGEMPKEQDFSGQFKLLWDQHYLYILAEITDDILFDQHPDPLFKYWDDDCLEIFVDEDNSGGEHQFNFNAFAYHVALDNQAVDIGTKKNNDEASFVLLNDHIQSRWLRHLDNDHKIIWEVSVKLFDDTFVLDRPNQYPVTLTQGKKIGFMLAYCDNDGSAEREHFLGSVPIKPINGDKNLGYKTADVFQTFMLIP